MASQVVGIEIDSAPIVIAQVETVLGNKSAGKLLDAAHAGRISQGEATIYAYEIR